MPMSTDEYYAHVQCSGLFTCIMDYLYVLYIILMILSCVLCMTLMIFIYIHYELFACINLSRCYAVIFHSFFFQFTNFW
jgi:hypothetical protein